MRLVTIQDKAAYDDLCVKGVLRCNPNLAEWLHKKEFRSSYDWLIEQMKQRIGEPPDGVSYPIWAWYLIDGKPAKVDLRRTEFNNYKGEHYALTIEVPDDIVLLSDEENWHYVLNNWFLGLAINDTEYDREQAWLESLPKNEQQYEKQKSWKRIFDISPLNTDWHRRGFYVQATFWELRKEQIVSVRQFFGRQNLKM